MIYKPQLVIGATGLILGLSAWATASYAADAVIDQVGLKFVPATVTINAGDSVHFGNHDPFTHDVTVVSPDGSKSDKGMQHHGEDRVVAFPKAGTYLIICEMHPNMKATVIVK
jgi:plastocyanin